MLTPHMRCLPKWRRPCHSLCKGRTTSAGQLDVFLRRLGFIYQVHAGPGLAENGESLFRLLFYLYSLRLAPIAQLAFLALALECVPLIEHTAILQ